MTQPEADFQIVVKSLVPGGRLIRAEKLIGGVSANVFRLDIQARENIQSYVFRQHPANNFKDHHSTVVNKEYELLGALHEAGLAVAKPLLLVDDQRTRLPFLVTEWVEGSTAVNKNDLSNAIEQMAQFLSTLHQLDPETLKIPILEPIEEPANAALRQLPDSDAGDAARKVLNRRPNLKANRWPSVLHGDFWPGNILWYNQKLAAVIDWEDACLGDPLADLATARLELRCQYGANASRQFTASYMHLASLGPLPLRLDMLRVWEIYVSASALSSMHEWGLAAAEETKRRASTETFLEEAAHNLE